MADNFQDARRTILVSGAGIAGLASALFIARAGYRVEVFEQADELDISGNGLQLSPNALHVLARLGLDRQVKSAAIAPDQIEIRSAWSGKRIVELPLGPHIIERYSQPYLVIYRADLLKILLAACNSEPDITVRMGVSVRDAVRHPNGISLLAHSQNATQNYRGAALIGADGVHSVIRQECFECKNARATNTIALRTMIKATNLPSSYSQNQITLWLGAQKHLVMYPIRQGGYFNLVFTVHAKFRDEFFQDTLQPGAIKGGLESWNDEVRDLITSNREWTAWPILEAPKLAHWVEERICLIGDAAHAMSPHAAQGAAMALEDAAVLGNALEQSDDLDTAFSQFYSFRIKRVAALRRSSHVNKFLYQLPQPIAFFRNQAMALMGGKRLIARQDWIYDWHIPNPH